MTLKTETYSLGSDAWTRHPGNIRISLTCPALAEIDARIETQVTRDSMKIPVPTTGDVYADMWKVSQTTAPTQAAPLLNSRAHAIADKVHAAVDNASSTPEGNPKPTNAAISAITRLIAVMPEQLLDGPDVEVFYGEIHLQWTRDAREIVLMAFSKDKEPLVHHYERLRGKESEHGIEKATAESLAKWLRWLNG